MLDYIELGKQQGAHVACGGSPPPDEALANGLFVQPTVLLDVTQDMRVAQDEIFGPVMCVLRWDDEATSMAQPAVDLPGRWATLETDAICLSTQPARRPLERRARGSESGADPSYRCNQRGGAAEDGC